MHDYIYPRLCHSDMTVGVIGHHGSVANFVLDREVRTTTNKIFLLHVALFPFFFSFFRDTKLLVHALEEVHGPPRLTPSL